MRTECPPNGSVGGRFEIAGDHDWFKLHVDPLTHYVFTSFPPTNWATEYPASSIWMADASGKRFPYVEHGFEPDFSGDVYIDVLGFTGDRNWTGLPPLR